MIMPLQSCHRRSSLFLAAAAAMLFVTIPPSITMAFQQQGQQHYQIIRPKPTLNHALTTNTPLFSSSRSSEGENNSKPSSSSSMMNNAMESIQQNMPDLSNLLDARESIVSNIVDGELGRRGEVYTLAQLVLLLSIALGGVPVIGGVVSLIGGPLLLLLGLTVMLSSATEMGPTLSPWPVPSKETTALLKQGWLYGNVRHPMYAGLLATCVGFAVATGDTTRLLLTIVLWYILDVKTNKEEVELRAIFGTEYDQYQRDVTGKFVPNELLAQLPWSSSSEDNSKKQN